MWRAIGAAFMRRPGRHRRSRRVVIKFDDVVDDPTGSSSPGR
jgi:hypothetical protein